MRKLTFEEACFQWASGFYLTEHVPDKFFDWTENGQEGFMGDHLWEPFEFWTGHDDCQRDRISSTLGRAWTIPKEGGLC